MEKSNSNKTLIQFFFHRRSARGLDKKSIQIIEAAQDKTYNKTCATSKDSDQSVYLPSMTRVLENPLCIAGWLLKAHAISEDSDQTARMRSLISAFAGRTSHIVGFVMRCLKLFFYFFRHITNT